MVLGRCFKLLYAPGTQMTPVLIEKDLVLEGLRLKIEDKQVPGIAVSSLVFNGVARLIPIC